MSLIKQLWLAVGVLMFLAFTTSFTISTFSAANYYEEQLRLKNIDNANSLALMLSQMEKDDVMIELLIAAQFDTGHYSRISLLNPLGEVYLQKDHEQPGLVAIPSWFMQWVDLQVEPGVALVQDGWHQFGTLYVESDTRFAYESFWTTTKQFLVWFFAVTFILGALGTYVLKWITRPLDDVVAQAEAIGGRRFITSSEPKTLEFGRVVRAMNILSERIRAMLESESRRLEEMRYKNQHDQVTGVANREYFSNLFESQLNDASRDSQHAIYLLRLLNLQEINQLIGHQATDKMMQALVAEIRVLLASHKDCYADYALGRLNGRDFVVMLTESADWESIAEKLALGLKRWSEHYSEQYSVKLPMAACYFNVGEQRADVFMRLDSLLVKAEAEGGTCLMAARNEQAAHNLHGKEIWRQTLTRALKEKDLRAEFYPVVTLQQDYLHREAMMRLMIDQEVHSAGYFIPWIRRLNLMAEFDLAMVSFLLEQMRTENEFTDIAINISLETLRDTASSLAFISLLESYPQQTRRLWLEFNERSVMEELALFKAFCMRVKPLGCKIGLDRAGADFARIANLQDIGLDYLKVDGAFVTDLEQHPSNSEFLRGLTTLAHSIGLVVIASGVQSEAEFKLLANLGLDGMTGPYVKRV